MPNWTCRSSTPGTISSSRFAPAALRRRARASWRRSCELRHRSSSARSPRCSRHARPGRASPKRRRVVPGGCDAVLEDHGAHAILWICMPSGQWARIGAGATNDQYIGGIGRVGGRTVQVSTPCRPYRLHRGRRRIAATFDHASRSPQLSLTASATGCSARRGRARSRRIRAMGQTPEAGQAHVRFDHIECVASHFLQACVGFVHAIGVADSAGTPSRRRRSAASRCRATPAVRSG